MPGSTASSSPPAWAGLGWAASKVSRIEHGKQSATSEDVTAWAAAALSRLLGQADPGGGGLPLGVADRPQAHHVPQLRVRHRTSSRNTSS
jgi:hypothetical protein